MLPLTSTGVQYVYCTYRTVVYLYTLAEYCGPCLYLCTCGILRRRRKSPGLFPKFRIYCILGTRTAPSANVSQTIHHTHQLQELVVRGALALTSAASNGVDVTGDPYRLFFCQSGQLFVIREQATVLGGWWWCSATATIAQKHSRPLLLTSRFLRDVDYTVTHNMKSKSAAAAAGE